MDYTVICVTAFLVSGLTLFSGFGLGTVLMPAFALFFPLPVAIAATAVVHLANNVFKVLLLGRQAAWPVVGRFGIPAAIAAILGAGALGWVAGMPVVGTYDMLGYDCRVTLLGLIIGGLIVIFALADLTPTVTRLAIPTRYLPLGGLISGFFGGLSGHQGTFRAAFLIKLDLTPKVFVATNAVSAVIVDTVRLTVYGTSTGTAGSGTLPSEILGLVLAATATAFAGAFLGAQLLHKVTIDVIRWIVAGLMLATGVGLGLGML